MPLPLVSQRPFRANLGPFPFSNWVKIFTKNEAPTEPQQPCRSKQHSPRTLIWGEILLHILKT